MLTNGTADAGSAVPFIMRKERHEIAEFLQILAIELPYHPAETSPANG